jgi:hypothetical protein
MKVSKIDVSGGSSYGIGVFRGPRTVEWRIGLQERRYSSADEYDVVREVPEGASYANDSQDRWPFNRTLAHARRSIS